VAQAQRIIRGFSGTGERVKKMNKHRQRFYIFKEMEVKSMDGFMTAAESKKLREDRVLALDKERELAAAKKENDYFERIDRLGKLLGIDRQDTVIEALSLIRNFVLVEWREKK
jgi:hypothetical protein